MAKGWKSVYTNKDTTEVPNLNRIDKTIRSMKTPTYEQLKKEFDDVYEKQTAEDANILAAFEDKRLKSKNLIKRAIKLQKAKEKAEQKKAEKTAET